MSARRVLIVLSIVAGAVAWAVHPPGTARRVAARGIRALVGPPRPAPGTETQLHPVASDTGSPGTRRAPSAGSDAPVEGGRETGDPIDASPELAPGPERPPERPRRPRGLRGVSTLLVLGMDNRSDRVTGRTDTMILVAFRHRDGRVAAFSVPRDLWVELPEGLGPARLSSAVRIGEVKLGPGKGVPLLRRSLRETFGVRVDRYVAVDLAGFVAAVDAAGGVEVDVPCPIVDCFWDDGASQAARESGGCVRLEVPAGRQPMDGATALRYARSRHGRGDRSRTRRQQAVLLGLARSVRARGLHGLESTWSAVRPHLETDLDWDSVAYFGSFALETDLDDVGGFAIRVPMVRRHVTVEGKHVLQLDPEAFDDAMAGMFATRLPALVPPRRCPAADVALRGR